jgi:hypothetical protein
MPPSPSPSRPHSVDLLLCGHHYRVSRAKLEASGAVVKELPGHTADVAAALFQEVSEPAAEAVGDPPAEDLGPRRRDRAPLRPLPSPRRSLTRLDNNIR